LKVRCHDFNDNDDDDDDYLLVQGAPKTGPLCFTVCNFRSMDHFGTKSSTNQRYVILNIATPLLGKKL